MFNILSQYIVTQTFVEYPKVLIIYDVVGCIAVLVAPSTALCRGIAQVYAGLWWFRISIIKKGYDTIMRNSYL